MTSWAGDETISLLRLVEVHYRGEEPVGYSEPFMCGDDLPELQSLVERLRVALEQPILDEADFPIPAKFEFEDEA